MGRSGEAASGSSVPLLNALAGICGGVTEKISMFPVDTVKTRMQASPSRIGATEAVRAALRDGGCRGLMRGSPAISAGCFAAHGGLFMTYELAVARLVDQDKGHQPVRMAACGAISMFVHDCFLTPFDVVKQRLQLGRHDGAVDCVRAALRGEGLRGLYRSFPVTVAMNGPYTATLVVCNSSLQRALGVGRGGGRSAEVGEAPWYFVCAGVSGAFAGALTNPLDVLKTRLQTQSPAAGAPRLGAFRAVAAAAQDVAAAEGLRGFCRGLPPRVVLSAPSSAICWGTYETVRAALHRAAAARAPAGGAARLLPGEEGGVRAPAAVVAA